jgi:hypothetical protein
MQNAVPDTSLTARVVALEDICPSVLNAVCKRREYQALSDDESVRIITTILGIAGRLKARLGRGDGAVHNPIFTAMSRPSRLLFVLMKATKSLI